MTRKNDFNTMDQLGKTPSKISILPLLLSSEAHKKSLMKVLNVAQLIHNITVDHFDDVVANITTIQYLSFNEVEFPAKGTAHNKSLHIFITFMDTLLSRFLVDIGSSLNVIPKNTLSQLLVGGSEMRANPLVVRDFDGSRRQAIG